MTHDDKENICGCFNAPLDKVTNGLNQQGFGPRWIPHEGQRASFLKHLDPFAWLRFGGGTSPPVPQALHLVLYGEDCALLAAVHMEPDENRAPLSHVKSYLSPCRNCKPSRDPRPTEGFKADYFVGTGLFLKIIKENDELNKSFKVNDLGRWVQGVTLLRL
ncbi:MAG: hypothetical protein ABSG25_06100 [Bryobacteraceae bacterium]|jgi:hypothetical protein